MYCTVHTVITLREKNRFLIVFKITVFGLQHLAFILSNLCLLILLLRFSLANFLDLLS